MAKVFSKAHPRVPLFSVTISDCRVDTFTVGGHGGSGKDTSNTGVRVTHEPSGASAEGTRGRSQLHNKQAAFRRMAESTKFKAWVKMEASRLSSGKSIDDLVQEALEPRNIKEEIRKDGVWVVNQTE